MRGARLVVLLIAGCARGAAVDVELFADPPASLSLLTVKASSRGTALETLTFPADGGTVELPTSLRLLVDATSLDVEATGFDLQERTRHQTGGIATLATGATEHLRLDLSQTGYCPAPPPASGEVVAYDDEARGGYIPFGYAMAQFGDTQDPRDACSGSVAIEYSVRRQYDGFGVIWPAPLKARRVSLRAWLSEPSQFHFAVEANNTTYWLPDPPACANNFALCSMSIEPRWQLISFDIPANLPALDNLALQIDAYPGHPMVLRVDDVRILPQ
jgi:hypothetical protein